MDCRSHRHICQAVQKTKLQIISKDYRSQRHMCHIIQKKTYLQIIFYGLQIPETYMAHSIQK
jgi:hypothetical protein